MVSMKEVARRAGVSQAAVSYAYTRPDKLSKAQREAILTTARDLGYPGPHIAAQTLHKGRIGAIGVVVPDSLQYAFADPSAFAILKGISEVSELADMPLTVVPLSHVENGHDLSIADLDGAVFRPASPIVRGLVDGLVCFALADDSPTFLELARRSFPMVSIDSPVWDGVPSVTVEDREGMAEILAHVVGLGHRRFLVVIDKLSPSHPLGEVSAEDACRQSYRVPRQRMLGILDCAKHSGIALSDLRVLNVGSFALDDAEQVISDAIAIDCPTCIIGVNDIMAEAAMKAVTRRGMQVPLDVSITGFDDSPVIQSADITSVRQPMVEKGRLAARMLLELLDGKSPASAHLATQIVVRGSTGEPRR